MIELIIVGEGPTEETFVRDVLAPRLWDRQILVQPRLIRTSGTGRGGALDGQRVLLYLRNTLRQRRDTYVTTFFDLYGLPSGFPGLTDAAGATDPIARAERIEADFASQVVAEAGCRADRFFAHIQPYEFEALIFSEVPRLSEYRPEWKAFATKLAAVRQSAPSPEHINDGPHTHPSARLKDLKPPYEKVLHGPALVAKIGLDHVRAECAHFAAWLTRLESLPAL